MRDIERIPKCLILFRRKLIFLEFTDDEVLYRKFLKHYRHVKEEWLKYPDMRFGQLLCTLRYVTSIDTECKIWNVEEINWLKTKKYLNE
jgi:hypothetical protein